MSGHMGPNFIIIGAGKSATTSLAAQLGQHPEIFITEPKEPHYFSFEHGRGPGWYASLFSTASDAPARGEASVTYTQAHRWPGVADRIATELGRDCRFIQIMRHPVRAFVSHVFHDLTRGHIPADTNIGDLITPDGDHVWARRYAWQLEPFLNRFDRQNFLFLTYEDYVAEPARILSEVYDFLGVNTGFAAPDMSARNISEGQVRKPAWYRQLKAIRRRYLGGLMPKGIGRVAYSLQQAGSQPIARPELTPEEEYRLWTLLVDDVRDLSVQVDRDMLRFWEAPASLVTGGAGGGGT